MTKDFSTFFSNEANLRKASVMAHPAPGTISLSTGLPNPECFPLKGITLNVESPESSFQKSNEIKRNIIDNPDEIISSCQYMDSNGLKYFNEWVKNYIIDNFKPCYQNWDFIIQSGATQSLDALFRMLINPIEDTILCESLTYSCFLETCIPFKINLFSIKMDENGILPDDLNQLLTNWYNNENTKKFKFPKLLYTMPTGHNPTGITLSSERREKLLEICNTHNILIIEDDPYYHLQIDDDNSKHIPSLLKFDTEGRVIRIDSFSKMLMPGLRVSIVTCNKLFRDKLANHNELSIHSASASSQLILQMIFKDWGHDGYLKWLDHLQSIYRRRRNIMLEAFDKYLPHKLVTYNRPIHGMFIWINIKLNEFPKLPNSNYSDSEWATFIEDQIHKIASEKYKVILSKGHWFMHDKSLIQAGFRATYSYSEEDNMIKGAESFGNAINDLYSSLYSN